MTLKRKGLSEKLGLTDKKPLQARVRKPLFDDLPDPIRDSFEGIWREGVRLHFRWHLHQQIYGSDARVALLKELGPIFFGELQALMQDDVVLRCARLVDRTKRTMTVHLLVKDLAATSAKGRVHEFRCKADALEKLARPLTAHRHNRIAHLSIEHHPVMVGSVLPGISIALIEDFLDKLRGFVRDVANAAGGGGPINTPTSQEDDGDTLIWNLCKAGHYDEIVHPEDAHLRSMTLHASRFSVALKRVETTKPQGSS